MADFVYPPVLVAARLMFRLLDNRIRVTGAEHVPARGGAVLACTHVSYLDFIYCGLGARPAKRLVRFMAKQEIFSNSVAGPLMRGMHHIPVDRAAGQASYDEAVARLRAGEVVGVFPEATISRSFTVKDIKTGAVRMAAEAGVPVIPMALWGTQRLWTKGRPRDLTRRHVPISVVIGEPMRAGPEDSCEALTTDLRARMSELLEKAQAEYPEAPESDAERWWLPAHLGGSAPTPEEAAALDRRS
ncbi:1-acyl-sn-glycerol-3-phosphate acyltransferase [Amycolatopsis rubida]|uniref:1-acyl-sn-glycerol-3-phosphate acyltransferase n=1 Tax=Amycolatopsis rubida TaxID=112413 RepID=A0A1I5EMM3_9PSEU|nr:lysophospholipid acyltransferase family protein [Amycolatopsis rubida]MYW97110.1 1-acyl-sn-glycerol-3-phosphate acyltransferase [Amycolatopsis rubida]NEC62095.1 1-acyl-sn-glycerol-3-phosphate acyltransferase [Amycolatopsis rubida]SFO12583.1 1-acyl-sn-glycerol-3-phosphate acyltransferases [Amycolatopsis rubida]